MAGRFSFSSPESRYGGPPWFRVGDFDVSTTILVTAAVIASLFVWAISPDLLEPLVLNAGEVRSGEVWRLVTWPFANQPDLWAVITIAIFWYFGREVEGLLGRNRFAIFLVILAVVPAVVATLLDFDVWGLEYLELGVFLAFIAEYPFVRFFFGVPGWVIGAVIVGLQVLQFVGTRNSDGLAFLAVLLATTAITARSYGLATSLPWIPKVPLPGSAPTSGGSGRSRGSGGSRRRSRRSSPRPSTPTRTVVEGPWSNPTPARPDPDAAEAQVELDRLLDKISASGLDSLSTSEKKRLNELSKRLR